LHGETNDYRRTLGSNLIVHRAGIMLQNLLLFDGR
jgi:hypothetical protein